jgi:tryptophan 2-monooxygenase
MVHWPKGTTLESFIVVRRAPVSRALTGLWRQDRGDGSLGRYKLYDAVLVALQSWLLTTYMQCEEICFRRKCGWRWTARATCSRQNFCYDGPAILERQGSTYGHDLMSMTLTDRLTRGTYLFDNGDDKPGSSASPIHG